MRFPLKLNRSGWPRWLAKLAPVANDPRAVCGESVDETGFTEAVSAFKFGTTFKTTRKDRFLLTIRELAKLPFATLPVILDIGASDGSTSLDVMKQVAHAKYYVTDLNIEIRCQADAHAMWFYDEHGGCILRASDRWVAYPDRIGAVFPFGWISRALFARAPDLDPDARRVALVRPSVLVREGDVIIRKHDVLQDWSGEKADLIIIANVLNRVYFSDATIGEALGKLKAALTHDGRIAIIDNRPGERSTIFRFPGGEAAVETRINGGTEIENLALATFGVDAGLSDGDVRRADVAGAVAAKDAGS